MFIRTLALTASAAALAWAAMAQTPAVEGEPADIPATLAERLPCDEDAGPVLADWLTVQPDPALAHRILERLAAETDACAPVREAAIRLAATMDMSADDELTRTAPGIASIIPEAFDEARQRAERLSFSVEPPPRNLTRSRIY